MIALFSSLLWLFLKILSFFNIFVRYFVSLFLFVRILSLYLFLAFCGSFVLLFLATLYKFILILIFFFIIVIVLMSFSCETETQTPYKQALQNYFCLFWIRMLSRCAAPAAAGCLARHCCSIITK